MRQVALLALAVCLPLALADRVAAAIRVTGRIAAPPATLAATTIELEPSRLDYTAASKLLAADVQPAPVAAAKPRADGSFEVVAAESGIYRLTVRAAGCVPLSYPLGPLLEDVELPPVTPRPASALELRALGPSGEAVAGVAVVAWPESSERAGDTRPWPTSCSSSTSAAASTPSRPSK